MPNRNDYFAGNMERTLQEQVVAAMNRTSQTVLDRREQIVGGVLVDCRKKRLKRRARHEMNPIAEQLDRCLLTKGSALSLESYSWHDLRLVHSFNVRTFRSTHLAPWPELQPAATHE